MPTLETSDVPNRIDVIVPVYRGTELTQRCIESVLSSARLLPFRLLVVDDCSPEPELSAWLQEQAAAGRFTLLVNEENLGFVGSVNRAMSLHPEHDKVLLNSDAEVTQGWLDRLHRAAYSAADIGTATPFSNNATICSYPAFPHGGELPDGWSLQALDSLFAQCNRNRTIDLPTAVGFCMYIRTDCLAETGLFDEQAFGKGYGEENDFCLRASTLGWRHVLCADCFVLHAGAVSFSETRHKLQDNARRILLERYPDYDQTIAAFIAADPAHELRKSIDITRLARSPKPVVLAVSHQRGGGVDKHLREFAQRHASELELLVLEPRDDGWASLYWNASDERFTWGFRQIHAATVLPWLVQRCSVERLYVHHLLGYSEDFVQTLSELGLPCDFMLHDYYYPCPQIHLQQIDHSYCGEPDNSGCNTCLKQRPVASATDIHSWRAKHHNLLQQAANIYAPSQDTALRYLRYFPDLNISILPHDEVWTSGATVKAIQPTPNEPLHIVVLGALGYAKGFETLRQAALQAQVRELPLRFTLLGHGDALLPEYPLTSLITTGPYRDEALAAWLQRLQPHLVWFPALIPETYSFTLSACMRAGLPVAATNLGAFPERLAGRPWSWLLPANTTASQWLDFFTAIRAHNFLADKPPSAPEAYQIRLPVTATYPTPERRLKNINALISSETIRQAIHGLPTVDISLVTYNSSRWLDDFFTSLEQASYPLSCIRLLVRDNGSSDDTLIKLEAWLQRLSGQIAGHRLDAGFNIGFGKGHNCNLAHAQSDFILVSNLDLQLDPDALMTAVTHALQDTPETACWEFRQKPYEHPKHYDPTSLETAWSSSACALFRTRALQHINGYEPRIFMYGEDVELSYRLRDHGYTLRYLPRAVCHHYSHTGQAHNKPLQLAGAAYAGVALRMRYAGRQEILNGWKLLAGWLRKKPVELGYPALFRTTLKLLRDTPYYLGSRTTRLHRFPFSGFDYEIARAGALIASPSQIPAAPKVSLLLFVAGFQVQNIRRLFHAVNHQTFRNFEVIILDDQREVARAAANLILASEFKVHYLTAQWNNRAQAGNAGLERARGDLIAFLDPMGLPYADHLEMLVSSLNSNKDIDAVYTSYAWPANPPAQKANSALPTQITYNDAFSRQHLWICNHHPMHAFLFRHTLYETYGGFAENLASHEDWHLWVKYSMHNKFLALDKTTLCMQLPAKQFFSKKGDSSNCEALNHELIRTHKPEAFTRMLEELGFATPQNKPADPHSPD